MIVLPEKNVVTQQAPGLGRIFSYDPNDQKFKMSATLPFEVTVKRRIWQVTGGPLDQGSTSECTAYSAEHLLLADPVPQPIYLTPNELYKLNQLNDEFEGENYEGSSVRAAMKVLQAAGYFESYVWANNADTVRRFVLMKGPCVLGTTWYSDMFKTTPSGFLRVRGAAVGGHAWTIIGADDSLKAPDGTRGSFLMINSWGKNWGYLNSGRAFISYKDVDGLIKNQGECVAPVEIKNITPKIITGIITT